MSEDLINKIINRRKQLENDILKLVYGFTKETGINVGEIRHRLETIGFDDGFGNEQRPLKTYTIKVKLEFPE